MLTIRPTNRTSGFFPGCSATLGSRYADAVVAVLEAFTGDGYFVLEGIGRFGEAIVGPLDTFFRRGKMFVL